MANPRLQTGHPAFHRHNEPLESRQFEGFGCSDKWFLRIESNEDGTQMDVTADQVAMNQSTVVNYKFQLLDDSNTPFKTSEGQHVCDDSHPVCLSFSPVGSTDLTVVLTMQRRCLENSGIDSNCRVSHSNPNNVRVAALCGLRG